MDRRAAYLIIRHQASGARRSRPPKDAIERTRHERLRIFLHAYGGDGAQPKSSSSSCLLPQFSIPTRADRTLQW